MPRDEYAKNFLMSGVTGSFSFYTLITYRMHINGHSLFIFFPLFSIFICGNILHYISLSGQEISEYALEGTAFCFCFAKILLLAGCLFLFSSFFVFCVCAVCLYNSLDTLFPAISFPLPSLCVFSYPFLSSPSICPLSCVSSVVLISDSLP